MNTYILSNTNTDSIKYYLPSNLKFIGSCSYGNYLIDLIDKKSILNKDNIELVIFLIDGDELKITNDLEDIFTSVRNFLNERECIFLLSTISLKPYFIDTYLNISNEFEFNTNSRIIDFCKEKRNLFVLDIHKIITKFGTKNCVDNKFWYVGRIKYTSLFFKEVSKEVEGILSAINTTSKKVLVLDLDNTIWGGVVGEDGNNILISSEGNGKIYSELQESVKYLGKTGVLLAINSKNNFADAIFGLNHKNSILCKDDFITIKANWNDKVTNLIEISDELNLGLDSFVFLDDNPVEREMVKSLLPEVMVPDFPEDLNYYNDWFIKDVANKHFPKTKLINEDLDKKEQYKANISREGLKEKIADINLFLKSLEIKTNIIINDNNDNAERLSQLTQKTNQFNLTTRRYNIKELLEFITSKSHLVYSLEYEDKFKNEGVVGMSIVNIKGKEAIIDTFLLSCRVLSRDIEFILLNRILKDLREREVKNVIGHYVPTKKNNIVKDFYSFSGFYADVNGKFIKDIEK